jgi:hypothetical protein
MRTLLNLGTPEAVGLCQFEHNLMYKSKILKELLPAGK